MSRGTQVPGPQSRMHFVYGTFTPSGRPSQWRSTIHAVSYSAGAHARPQARPYNPYHATVHTLHMIGLGSSPFARRYSGNLILMSFPPGT